MRYLGYLGGLILSSWAFAEADLPIAQKDGAIMSTQSKFVVDHSDKPIVEEIPAHMLTSNDRFLTLSVENDYFGSGQDRDYTNGLRLTYFNVGADQPFYVDWIDQITPTFERNKTTTSYFSFGHNLYTPSDITRTDFEPLDRPYAAFLYGSAGVSTITNRHMDNVELTFGMVGPSALGKQVQTEFHKFKGSDLPQGWRYGLKDEPALMLSWERSWPGHYTVQWDNNLNLRVSPHVGATLGNVYTYANAGVTVNITPMSARWQDQPVRVRPAIPGSGYFDNGDRNYGWMIFAGWDSRLVARNIFLDGNSFKDSHSVDKKWLVHDAALGAAYSYHNWRLSYSLNWRSKEFNSPLADDSVFGSLSINYRF
ncbi:lipid A deacylase LpxR family protein [Suttonella sp. R2A3]|uniref:lipid A deacylase LpxR family protein n=1 Tax=Suttonella sp. R2A3 TaxID=2908648 RepID=UPI001F2E321A|nr:lipid A deacylase LpxR family protein [Suttonella sp. R2A3]UJF24535.1 lipid A deacylase LpxR family protein [Suttonella sp. R2A3]